MNDLPLAASAPGLASLGLAIELSPRQSNPLLRILGALWRRATNAGHAIPAAAQNDRPNTEPVGTRLATTGTTTIANANGDRS
jgi:hypothetical protein